jgi:hypothetical protein
VLQVNSQSYLDGFKRQKETSQYNCRSRNYRARSGFSRIFQDVVMLEIKKPERVRFFYFSKEKLELEYGANSDQS